VQVIKGVNIVKAYVKVATFCGGVKRIDVSGGITFKKLIKKLDLGIKNPSVQMDTLSVKNLNQRVIDLIEVRQVESIITIIPSFI